MADEIDISTSEALRAQIISDLPRLSFLDLAKVTNALRVHKHDRLLQEAGFSSHDSSRMAETLVGMLP